MKLFNQPEITQKKFKIKLDKKIVLSKHTKKGKQQ